MARATTKWVNRGPTCRAVAAVGVLVSLALPPCAAHAALYKCTGADGRTEYTDAPCRNDPKATPWRPRQPLNVVPSESLTGQPKGPADVRPAWLKPPDPIGDCKRRGGTFDPEFRACRLP